MFTPKDQQMQALNEAIDNVFNEMSAMNADAPEYAKMQKQLSKLMKLRDELRHSRQVSPDTRANIFANLMGILIIVGYESRHALTSKAVGFLQKLR